MQAYATDGRVSPDTRLHSLTPSLNASASGTPDLAVVDLLLGRLADMVVDRLMEPAAQAREPFEEWLDARAAAKYLGVHRDTLRKLAAERAVPAHQDGPGCKLYFRRDELDEWRRSSRPGRRRLGGA